jgi:hypothetical protein
MDMWAYLGVVGGRCAHAVGAVSGGVRNDECPAGDKSDRAFVWCCCVMSLCV